MSANVSKYFYPIILFNNEPKIKVDDLGVWNCMVPAVGFDEVAGVASWGPSSICSSAGGAGWVVGAVMILINYVDLFLFQCVNFFWSNY